MTRATPLPAPISEPSAGELAHLNECMLSGLALPLSHYEAATLCGALAYTLGEDVAPEDDGVLRTVAVRLRTVIALGDKGLGGAR